MLHWPRSSPIHAIPTKVRHSLADLLRQRIFGLALGYPDANDVARIGADPMFRMLLDRDPARGEQLASQSTISRFENSATRRDLFRMGEIIAESVLDYHRSRLRRRRVRRITIDLDPTDSRTYGEQQLSFFNTHYGGHCYLPLLGFPDLQRGARAVPVCRRVALGAGLGPARGDRAAEKYHWASAPELPGGQDPRAPGRRLCRPRDVRVPRAATRRVPGCDGEKHGTEAPLRSLDGDRAAALAPSWAPRSHCSARPNTRRVAGERSSAG